MSFQETRGVVEKIDEFFTHVRLPVPVGLWLFNHKSCNAAPVELRKPGTEVLMYEDPYPGDCCYHIKAAPPRKTIPQRGQVPYDGVANKEQFEAELAHAEQAASPASRFIKPRKEPAPPKMKPEEHAAFLARTSEAINPTPKPKIPLRGR